MSRALENGIAVLEFISSKRACTVTEIAASLGINKSTGIPHYKAVYAKGYGRA